MPSAKYAHFAMWDDGDKSVLCCGGEDVPRTGCFKYAGDEWIDLGDILLHERGYSSAAELSDGRYWIAGGGYGYEVPSACACFSQDMHRVGLKLGLIHTVLPPI